MVQYWRYYVLLMSVIVFEIVLYIKWKEVDRNIRKTFVYEIANDQHTTVKTVSSKTEKGRKIILYWRPVYGDKNFMFGSGDVFKVCPVSQCYGTADRKYLDSIESYDAILFNGIEMSLSDLPPSRSPKQRYIFFSYESPASRPINRWSFMLNPHFYNWTMSYRLDSDVVRPYRVIRDLKTDEVIVPINKSTELDKQWRAYNKSNYQPTSEEMKIIEGKTKMAAWFVSHCQTISRREILAKELQRYFQVDIYGTCGQAVCSPGGHNEELCYGIVEKDYFFYLSFENTLCEDYLTEKFFLPLRKYVIPVVYGGGDYTKFAPPHSYINIVNFNTTEDLAKYLLRLSKDPEEYASYFWWKEFYKIENSTDYTLCQLCERLHDQSLPRKSVDNFQAYYQINQCNPPNQLSWLQNLNKKL